MRLGNSKLVIFNFLPHEYKSVEKYLEDMALKGWKLKSLTGFIFKFKRIEPKRIKYTVDVMDKISFFDGKNSDRTLEYREYCKEAGWDFICERDKIQIYSSENEIDSLPIHTDEREKYNCIFKASLKYVLLNIITIFLLLFVQYMATVGSSDGSFLASNLQLATLSFVSIFSIHEVVGLVTFIIWSLNGLKSLKNTERVCYDFHKSLKLKRALYSILWIMVLVQILFLVMLGDIFVLKFFILNLVMMGVIIALMNLVSRSKYKYKKKRKINITIYVSVIIITFISMNWLIFGTIFSGDESNNKIKPDNYILTLKDFNDEPKDETELYVRNESSFLASRIFYSNSGENMTLQYELFESKYEWAVKYHINKEIKFAKKIDVEYIEKDIGLPEDIKIYMNEHGHTYFMVSKDKVIDISRGDDGISEEELLNKVYEKVFK